MSSTKRLTLTALLTAAAIILGWLEHLVPLPVSVPWIKLGISNIAVVYALYTLGTGCALSVMGSKVLLSSMLFGGAAGLIYSAAGGIVSFIVMVLVSKAKSVTVIGTSAAGGAAHLCGQAAAAMLITATPQLVYLIAPFIAVGTVTGTITGLCAKLFVDKAGNLSERRINNDAEDAQKHEGGEDDTDDSNK